LGYQNTKNISSVAYVASILESYDTIKSHFENVITDRLLKCVDDIYKGIDDTNAKRSDEFQFNLTMLQDKLRKLNENQNSVTFQSFLF
jgi:hypothetical protein